MIIAIKNLLFTLLLIAPFYSSAQFQWAQVGLDIDGEAVNDNSGLSVSMNEVGDRLAIGAYLNDGNGLNSGHVRIYEWDTTAWVQMGGDIDGQWGGDESGRSVSMNGTGDRVAIGARFNGSSGHVRIYEWDSTLIAWTQLGVVLISPSFFYINVFILKVYVVPSLLEILL